MDIHKPKAARNWREFAIEIGTIICGILIALGLEQAIEWLHRHAEVAEARQAMRSEIAANAHAAKFNLEYSRCLLTMGGQIGAWAKGAPLPRTERPVPLNWITPGSVNWDVVKAGAAAHMPLRERLAYGRTAHDAELITTIIGYQADAWLALSAPLLAGAKLSPAELQRVGEDAARAQNADRTAIAYNRQLLQDAKAAGVEAVALSVEERASLTQFCNAAGVSPQLD